MFEISARMSREAMRVHQWEEVWVSFLVKKMEAVKITLALKMD